MVQLQEIVLRCFALSIVAFHFTTNSDCNHIPGMHCITDFCQPMKYTAAAQCVHGQICSHDPNK